jgi:hypothetical protein
MVAFGFGDEVFDGLEERKLRYLASQLDFIIKWHF